MKKIGFTRLSQFFDAVYKRWFRFVNFVPKRIRVVVCTAIMTSSLLISTFFPFSETWWIFVVVLAIIAYITTYIAVFEGIDGVEWYMLFVMPITLTVALYLFYSLLPVRWLTRLPFLVLYALTYYGVLLTSNIINIGVEKSLQLYRAAFSVNFLLQVFIMFLFSQVLLSFKLNFLLNFIFIFISAVILSLQLFWSLHPEASFNKRLLMFSNSVAILLAESAILISFIPLKTNVQALILTATYYSLNGIIYHYLDSRLFKNVIREYAFVAIFVFFIAILTLNW